MTAADWGKALIVSGILTVIVSALIYWIWPDFLAQRAVAGRAGSLLIMGGGGLLTALLGAFLVTNNAQ